MRRILVVAAGAIVLGWALSISATLALTNSIGPFGPGRIGSPQTHACPRAPMAAAIVGSAAILADGSISAVEQSSLVHTLISEFDIDATAVADLVLFAVTRLTREENVLANAVGELASDQGFLALPFVLGMVDGVCSADGRRDVLEARFREQIVSMLSQDSATKSCPNQGTPEER